jgi:hypothetical protein
MARTNEGDGPCPSRESLIETVATLRKLSRELGVPGDRADPGSPIDDCVLALEEATVPSIVH